jgi:quinol monooxygenase YgiN
MSEPLTIIATLRAKQGQESRAREALRGMLGPTHAEAGCINYDLHESQDDPALFVFYENWASAAHLDSHLKSAHFQALSKVIPEIFVGPPKITKWKKIG